eukprot:scaffold23225_cov158-Skeletonema_dohrnii-CCMP3373.AAC.3
MEEDEPAPRGRRNHRGGDAPPLTLQDLIAVACALGASHPDQIPSGNILKSPEAQTHYRPFVDFLIEKGYDGPEADFLDNSNYPLLKRSMPTVMQPITHEIQTWGDPRFFSEGYIAAFTAGDGSLVCRSHRRGENGEVKYRQSVQVLAIKGPDHPFKEWLYSHGWYINEACAVRTITPSLVKQIPFLYACDYLLSYKKLIWKVMVKLARATRFGVFNSPFAPMSRIATTIQIVVVSWLNSLHGVMLSYQWFMDDFQRMSRKHCVFDLFVAGIMGSDGGIYDNYYIFQSNRRWCRALARTMEDVYGLEEQPTISLIRNGLRRRNRGIRMRPTTTIRISARDSEKIAPRVAAFDMCRKDQQIIYLIRRLIMRSPNFPNKNRVQKFLEGTAKFIRKSRPS